MHFVHFILQTAQERKKEREKKGDTQTVYMYVCVCRRECACKSELFLFSSPINFFPLSTLSALFISLCLSLSSFSCLSHRLSLLSPCLFINIFFLITLNFLSPQSHSYNLSPPSLSLSLSLPPSPSLGLFLYLSTPVKLHLASNL